MAIPCGAGKYLLGCSVCHIQYSIYADLPIIGKIHVSRNQGMQTEIPNLTSVSLAEILLLVSITLSSAGLGVLKGGIPSPRDTTAIPLNWKLWLPPSHFWINRQKRELLYWLEWFNPDYKGEIGLLIYSECKQEFVWKTENSLGHL